MRDTLARRWPPRSPRASPGRASTSSTSAWPAPTCSTSPPARWTCPARCSPPATTRPATTASSCAAPAPRRSARTPGWPTIRDDRRGRRAGRARAAAPSASADMLAEYAAYLRGLVDLTGDPAAAGRGRRRQRHGRAHRPAVLGRAAAATSCRCTSSSTAASRTTRPTRWTRRTWSTCRSAVVAEGADLGLAFDGDADRCFVVDERGEPVSPSAITALVAVRELAKDAGRAR